MVFYIHRQVKQIGYLFSTKARRLQIEKTFEILPMICSPFLTTFYPYLFRMPKADDEGEVAVMPTFLRKFFFILFLVFDFGGKSCKERDALWKQSKNHEPNLIV